MRYFQVSLSESLITDINEFPAFNDFFIRRLKPGVRPLPEDPLAIACPADGLISELGKIHAGRLLQAKGRDYTLNDLFGGHREIAKNFEEGEFFTVYLAPKDYHRVHMPITGTLKQMLHVPGQLFSVNEQSVNSIPRLFARNERVICLFETAAGPMAVIFVGALLIGSVVTAWHGQVMPTKDNKTIHQAYREPVIHLERGDEAGYFQWGSTVIVLFGAEHAHWCRSLNPGDPVNMGQKIGEFRVSKLHTLGGLDWKQLRDEGRK